MPDDRVEVIKLQGGAAPELFSIVHVSGVVERDDEKIHSSQRPLTERQVRRTLRKGGMSDDEAMALIQSARRNFHTVDSDAKRR
jgi:hypothetical protein